MNVKNQLVCSLIIAILTLSALNIAVASTSNYSTTFHNNVRHKADYILVEGSSTPNGVVYIGSIDHNIYALDARTGTKVWNYTTEGAVDSSPTIANGIVYIGSADHNVYAIDANTGAKIWSYTTGGSVFSKPAITNGIVYVGSLETTSMPLTRKPGSWCGAIRPGN